MPRTEEGTIEVRVGLLPGRVHQIVVPAGSTVGDAIDAADIDGGGEGHEIRVNGSPAEEDKSLNPGDSIFLVREVRGN